MGKKFDTIYESVISRYTVGGYLPGDLIKFRPDYKKSETYKSMHSVMKAEVDNLAKAGVNIKVVQVGNKRPGTDAGSQHKTAADIVLTIGADQGGGRVYSSVTVSPDMVDVLSINDPTPNIPDEFYRPDNTNFKPEVYKADDKHITRQSDKGNGKNTPTNLKLAGEGTKLKNSNKDLSTIYEEVLNENI